MRLRRLFLLTPSFLCLSAIAGAAQKPKLVVGIVIDQFRYDYLTRFRADYHGGLDRLMTQGADFTNAFYGQIPTVTAVGHSIFLSGAMPAVSGIVNNSWFDRQTGEIVTSVCDWQEKIVGGEQPKQGTKCTDEDPASPRRLMVSTVGDEMVDADPKSTVIGISLKPRAAILPSGHRAKAAYWFDSESGNFVTSTFYREQLPGWAVEFNAKKLPDQYVQQPWPGFPSWKFASEKGAKYGRLPASPWGNELVEKFAEQALGAENLGQHEGTTDLLTVSFSSNDYVGHAVGPDAPEVRDMAIRVDQLIGKLLTLIDEKVGLANTIVVLTADHGVAATPAHDQAAKLPGGYVKGDAEEVVENALQAKFGGSHWVIRGAGETNLYLNWATAAKTKTEPEDVYRVAEQALMAEPDLHVARVYSREQLSNGIAGDFVATAAVNGFNPKRSGDVTVILEPNYVPGSRGTTHFSPYAYDRHVPILFMGPGIKPGHYNETVRPNDIAPTLATMLAVQTPSGSSGRVLTEMLAQ